jgi:NAD(P)H dehydrogenase (quinone)
LNDQINILIIFCHPAKQSYTYRVLEQLKNELSRKNFTVETSDLYAINFQSDMTKEEYNREAFAKVEVPVAKDVLEEHKKIDKAGCIIFLYPVWWSDCPAKLKGWFDRVFSVGYAYKQKEDYPKMEIVKYGVALCTAGYSNELLLETGLAQSMQNIMLNDRMGNRFEHKEMIILGDTLNLDKVKSRHTEQIEKLVSKIEHYLSPA